jgi:CheY-like chemotaxis protein
MLALEGYRILTADTFEGAVRTMNSAHPDLLIVDVRLGNFNGLQLIATSPVPVRAIVVTGFADSVLARDARQLGADYLVKPVTREVMLAAVERQLRADKPAAHERRWQRKPLAPALPTSVNRWPGRLLDVSYGGMRLGIDHSAEDLPSTLDVTVPHSNRLIQVAVIWKMKQEDQAWLCGAEVSPGNEVAANAWRDLVDAVG